MARSRQGKQKPRAAGAAGKENNVEPSKSFYDFMIGRQNAIIEGAMNVDSERLRWYNRSPASLPIVFGTGQKMASADRSDPFTENRTISHLLNGVALPSDYNAEFVKEHFTNPVTGDDATRLTPKNMKRP